MLDGLQRRIVEASEAAAFIDFYLVWEALAVDQHAQHNLALFAEPFRQWRVARRRIIEVISVELGRDNDCLRNHRCGRRSGLGWGFFRRRYELGWFRGLRGDDFLR